VIGVDFSEGMLRQASRKSVDCSWIHWVQADAGALPIPSCSVERVTCSYAMYELSSRFIGETYGLAQASAWPCSFLRRRYSSIGIENWSSIAVRCTSPLL